VKLEKISCVIDPEVKFSLVEESNEVDGEHILAKIKGQFFVPNGKSRNGRFYPSALWERVINDPTVKNRLNKRVMFGTVGHDAELNDKAVREGLISHFMTNIGIDDNGRGMGEALILNTPTGRILNTVLRAGSQLFVSSRANGTFKGKHDGLPVVDEDTYDIDGWDFVIDPGFLEANPSVSESLKKIGEKNMNINNKEVSMNEKLIEHISNENHELKTKVGNLTDEIKALEEDTTTIKEENTHLKSEMDKWEADKKVIESYTNIGTVEELTEKLAKADEDGKVLTAYNELSDSPEIAKETLESARDFIKTVTEEFGTIAQIKKALESAISFRESIEEMGTTDQIKEALTAYLTILEAEEAKKEDIKVKALAEELGIEEGKMKDLLLKYSEEDIKALLGNKKEEKPVEENKEDTTTDEDAYKKKNFTEEKKEEDTNTDVSESNILGKSRADRIAERYNRV